MKICHFLKSNVSVLLLLIVITTISCKTNSISKDERKIEHLALLDSLYKLDNYKIDINTAYPINTQATVQVANAVFRNTGNTANRIDMRGDGNFINITPDSVSGYLPFFGERRLNGGDYTGQYVAIQFNEPLKELDKTLNKDKGYIELNFNAKQSKGDNDSYDITIEIYPKQNVSINITPVYRTFIRYDGKLNTK